MPTPARFFPAPVPAAFAAAAGSADSPICFSESSGCPGRRRTRPPSWSVISSSGTARIGFSGLALAWSSSEITLAIWARLEMLPPKKMTPPTWPCRIQLSSAAGG